MLTLRIGDLLDGLPAGRRVIGLDRHQRDQPSFLHVHHVRFHPEAIGVEAFAAVFIVLVTMVRTDELSFFVLDRAALVRAHP